MEILASRRGVVIALLISGLLWLGLAWFAPQSGQTKVWYLAGQEYLSDYFMPRNTAAHANPYREPAHTLAFSFRRGGVAVEQEGWDLEGRDRAYPAGALLPLLPFDESLDGARQCNAVMIGVFLIVLFACVAAMRKRGGADDPSRAPLPRFTLPAVLLSGPMLFAYERGNPIWFAAAGTLVFLLGWNHPRRAVRLLAAAGLAVAGSIKVMPAALGVLYLPSVIRRARTEGAAGLRAALADPAVCVLLGVAAFALPWFAVAGFESFPDWWRTGHENVAYYAPRTTFGFVGFYRTAMIALHRSWEATDGFQIARWLNVVCGVGALAAAVWKLPRSKYCGVLLATAGMLLLGANMRPYTVLYLLPALLLWLVEPRGRSRFVAALEGVAWFVVWTPLQIPHGTVQLYPLANLAVTLLAATAAFGGRAATANQ